MNRQDALPVEFFLFGGFVLAAGVAIAAVVLRKKEQDGGNASSGPAAPWTELDVEAAARMLSSENPRGSRALHVEQIWTQIRSTDPGQTLYERITAGSGWGPQGQRAGGGKRRPVSTDQPTTEAFRQLARRVLAGLEPSSIPGARSFFEPAEQDAAFRIAERARAKQRKGEPLTPRESRLLNYRFDAESLRERWGLRNKLGTIDGVEFYR